MAPGNDATRPRVVLLSLEAEPYFDDMYQNLLAELQAGARIQRVEKAGTALRLLAKRPPPSAVIITDAATSVRANSRVWDAVVQYVRSEGGTAVVMGHFPSFVQPDDVRPFFARAGLPWACGSHHRTTLALDRDVVPRGLASKLPAEYSQKAIFVRNVAPAEAWYKGDQGSFTESHFFQPETAHVTGETAVAFASVGRGKSGYVGDVNAEQGSDAVILAMCGLL